MFSHANPRRVAIVGGGEGATLREVLKHDTVDRVTMVEIDEAMVGYSREYLRDWNTCDDIVGSAESCFEDPRADMRYEDAMAWFIKRFHKADEDVETGLQEEDESSDDSDDDSDDESEDDDSEIATENHRPNEMVDMVEPFDVIIMDALDPNDNVAFAEQLYSNGAFFRALFRGLSEDGILVVQQGELDDPTAVAPELGEERIREGMKRHLQDLGFVEMHEYTEVRGHWILASLVRCAPPSISHSLLHASLSAHFPSPPIGTPASLRVSISLVVSYRLQEHEMSRQFPRQPRVE